jgi:hypothetical protein
MNHIDPALAYLADTGDCILFWNERNSSQSLRGIYAQKITATGTRAWGESGLELMPVDAVVESYPRCARIDDGAAVFFTNDDSGQERLYGIRVDADGGSVWETSPLPVSTVVSDKSRYPLTINDEGMVVLVWEDDRDGTVDLFAQNVNADGSLGTVTTGVDEMPASGRPLLLTSHPNPFNPRTTVAFVLERAQTVRLSVLDLAGNHVTDLAAGYLTAGRHETVWDGRDARGRAMATGTYLLRLIAATGGETRKVTLVQ